MLIHIHVPTITSPKLKSEKLITYSFFDTRQFRPLYIQPVEWHVRNIYIIGMELYDIHLRRYKLALSKLGIDWIHEQYYHLFAIHDWKTCAWVAAKLNHYSVNTHFAWLSPPFDGCGKMQLCSATQVVTLKYGQSAIALV